MYNNVWWSQACRPENKNSTYSAPEKHTDYGRPME